MRHRLHVSHSKVHWLPVQCGMLGRRAMSRAGVKQHTTSTMSSSTRVPHLPMLAYSGSATIWYRPSASDVLERAVGWAPSSWSAVEQGEQWVSEAQSTSLGYRRVAAKTNERRTCIIIDRQRRSPPITRIFNNCTILQRAQGVLENTMAIRLRGELPLPSKNLFTLTEYRS